ncbi:hypothetical protein ILYODFUR_030707 [Ilyodon furcidens]|uniref:Uncharacterized protein n=1 Tax=Ilyodon furcidens TaxID=33524 RepID=A0ABV0UDZ5_9TELE
MIVSKCWISKQNLEVEAEFDVSQIYKIINVTSHLFFFLLHFKHKVLVALHFFFKIQVHPFCFLCAYIKATMLTLSELHKLWLTNEFISSSIKHISLQSAFISFKDRAFFSDCFQQKSV